MTETALEESTKHETTTQEMDAERFTHSYETNPKTKAFLTAYAETGNITSASQAVGIDRTLHYHWLTMYTDYADAFQTAKDAFADRLEDIAMSRILNPGKGIGGDVLLITLLNAHKPEKYRGVQVDDTTAKELRTELQKMRKEWREQKKDREQESGSMGEVTPVLLREVK